MGIFLIYEGLIHQNFTFWTRGLALVIKHLPSKHEALYSTSASQQKSPSGFSIYRKLIFNLITFDMIEKMGFIFENYHSFCSHLFFFSVLGLEFRTSNLSQSTSPFL
jgi:hypothetical protein